MWLGVIPGKNVRSVTNMILSVLGVRGMRDGWPFGVCMSFEYV